MGCTRMGAWRVRAWGCAGRAFAQIATGVLGLVLLGCGGGGGGSEPTPAAPGPGGVDGQAAVLSGASPVAAGCTGGPPAGTLYAGAEVEPFAATNPRDPQHLVAVWQQDRWSGGAARALVAAVSFDGGRSWSRQLLPFSRCGGAAAGSAGDYARTTDPWVDFAPDGTVHVMGLSLEVGALLPGSASAMLAARSVDGGRSWGPPSVLVRDGASVFNDKNSLTADPTDPQRVYAVWDRIDLAGLGPTLMARSVDGGRSWEAARPIYVPQAPSGASGESQTIGNRIVVRPDGTLVNLFTQVDRVGGRDEAWLGVLLSADKGQSWSAPVRIASLLAVGARDPQTGKAIRDGAILASIAALPDGSLWVAWQDARFEAGQRDAIVGSRSADGGLSWGPVQRLSRVASATAFTPTLAVRPDGVLGLLHYDLRDESADAATLLASAWLLSSRDGGASWAETRVREPFDLNRAADARGWFLGDYQGLTASGTAFVPVFAVTTGQAGNPSDIVGLRVEPPLAAAVAKTPEARARPRPELAAAEQARRGTVAQALQQRLR